MLTVRLLGGLALEVDGRAVPAPTGRRGSLLAWLALNPGMQPRSRVAARLWPDVLDESARRSLRTALMDLRSALGPEAAAFVQASRDEVGLGPADQVRVDVGAFTSAVADGRLDEALALAQGELLPEFEHEWVFEARDAHRREVGRVIEELAREAERQGELQTAIEYTRRVVAMDPLAEEHARELIRRLAAADDRAAALAEYGRHRDRLRTELGVTPSAATRALVDEIRGDDTAPAPDTEAVALPSPLETSKALYGREDELAVLIRGLRDVVAGGGLRGFVLAGEPGIGKTRLVAELCRIAHSGGATVLYGRCHEDGPFPYAPFVEALRGYVAAVSPDHIHALVGPAIDQIAKLVPQLAEDATSAVANPETERLRLFDAITSLLAGAARSAPLVLALDDLHWSDRPTLSLLDYLIRIAPRSSILVLGTYRDTEPPDDHPLQDALVRLRRERIIEHVAIAGLQEPAVAELARASSPDSPPETLVHALFEQTGGNPYFVEEFMRDLGDVESQPIAEALARLGVPESIRELIWRRLARLSDSTRATVSAASVIGPEFDLELLALVTAIAEDPLIDALDEAAAAHVVVELPRAAGSFGFAHALVRETLYGRLSATRRAHLHRRVGHAIEARYGEDLDDHLPALARHGELAGDTDRALRHHQLAGDAAVRVHAADAALHHYSRALDAAVALGHGADDAAVYRLHHSRARVLQRAGDLRGALRDGEAAVAGARLAGDVRSEIDALDLCGFIQRFFDVDRALGYHEAALHVARGAGDARAQAAALGRMSIIYSSQLRLDEAVRFGEQALEIAKHAGDEAAALALDAVKLAALQIGDLAAVDRTTTRLLELHHRVGGEWELYWLDDWVLLERAYIPIATCDWERAITALNDATSLNRRLSNKFSEPIFLDALGWLHRSRGDYERAVAYGSEAVDLAAALETTEWSAWTNATLGWTLLEAGDAPRAVGVLEHGIVAADAIGVPAQRLRCYALLAWAKWEIDDRAGGVALADQAEALVASMSAPVGRTFLLGAHALLALARVRLAAGDPVRARQLVAPVLAAAKRSGWLETIAYASLLDGSCRVALGDPEAGAAEIEESLELARKAGLPWVEGQAQTKLGAVTAARR